MDHDQLLMETLLRHFSGAALGDRGIVLGIKDVHLQARVAQVREMGDVVSASLYLHLSGGPFDEGVFASASGYGATEHEAIVSGACNWATVYGPVLQAGLTGETLADVPEFEVVHHGQRFRVVLDGLDRGLALGADPDLEAVRRRRRELAPSGWLLGRVFDAGVLPVLRGDRPTTLSVFVGDGDGQRTVEVKVSGVDWPAAEAFASVPMESSGRVAFLREFALAVPMQTSPALERTQVEATLRGLETPLHGPRQVVGWPGWAAHGGRLGPSLDPAAVERLEGELGVALPPAYREFVLRVAASGAGPGYGLLPPDSPAQRELARGTFDWKDGKVPASPLAGVLALAHAGCGVMWLLVLSDPRAGEVWVDAGGSDELARRVAPDFQAWYRAWLESCVRDQFAWTQWQQGCCAPQRCLSQVFTDFEQQRGLSGDALRTAVVAAFRPGAMATASAGGPYFVEGEAVSPCAGCVDLFSRIGIAPSVFALGVAPRQGRSKPEEQRSVPREQPPQPAEPNEPEPAPQVPLRQPELTSPPRKGFWSRLFGR